MVGQAYEVLASLVGAGAIWRGSAQEGSEFSCRMASPAISATKIATRTMVFCTFIDGLSVL